MGIDARIEAERGEVVTSLGDPHNRMYWLLSLAVLDSTFCLRFIDPYGNTIFNGLQIPILQSELTTLLTRLTEANLGQSKQAYLERAQVWPQQALQDARKAIDMLLIGDLRSHLEELLRLVSAAISKGPHHYVRFVGD